MSGNAEIFEIWKMIYWLWLRLVGHNESNKNQAEVQQHILEHTIDRMEPGVRKDAALEAFRDGALHTRKSRQILKKYG